MIKTQLRNALLILAVILPAFMISCNKDDEVKLDFEITVPDNWNYLVLANEGAIYSAGRRPVDAQDSIREGLLIYKEKLPNWTLDQYYAAIRNNVINSDYYLGTIYQSDTTYDNTDFKKWISRELVPYINDTDTVIVNSVVEHYFFFKNSYGYNFIFNTVDSLYNENRDVFSGIMSSFDYIE